MKLLNAPAPALRETGPGSNFMVSVKGGSVMEPARKREPDRALCRKLRRALYADLLQTPNRVAFSGAASARCERMTAHAPCTGVPPCVSPLVLPCFTCPRSLP